MEDRRAVVASVETFYRRAPAPAGRAPVVYVHGNPTSSDDWLEPLARTGGIAPDLPGFGRSGKPASFGYSVEGYSDWLAELLDEEGIERYSLVVHDWGAAALGLAQRAPERLERLVIVNAVPLLPGYRWHRLARVWRMPLVGELAMGFTTRWGLRQLSREATVADGPAPDAFIDGVWEHFDHGTQRAILKLYRSSPEDLLERAGERLGAIRAPALVMWGAEDPYIPATFAQAYADALGGEARVELVQGASHWPWLDRPETLGAIADFLLA